MPKRLNGIGLTANQEAVLMQKAMSGDMEMVITPTAVAPVPTAAAWTRKVLIEIKTAAGEVHTWLNKATATILSIADTGGGTATCSPATTLTLTNGVATIVVSGTAATWANGETDTLTVGDLTLLGYTVTGGDSVETFTT